MRIWSEEASSSSMFRFLAYESIFTTVPSSAEKLLLFCLEEGVWIRVLRSLDWLQIVYEVQHGFELLILLPPPTKYYNLSLSSSLLLLIFQEKISLYSTGCPETLYRAGGPQTQIYLLMPHNWRHATPHSAKTLGSNVCIKMPDLGLAPLSRITYRTESESCSSVWSPLFLPWSCSSRSLTGQQSVF